MNVSIRKAGSSGDSRLFVLYFFKVYRDFFPACAYRLNVEVMICVCGSVNDDVQCEISVIDFITVDFCEVINFRCGGEVVTDILCEFKSCLFFHVFLLIFTVPSVIFQCPCCR